MLTNQQIFDIAMKQSAVDLNCQPEDFTKKENIIVHSVKTEGYRKYLTLPFFCQLVSYGENIVASVDPQIEDIVKSYMDRYSAAHCFETPNMHVLSDAIKAYGMRICFMAEYFLPDVQALKEARDKEFDRRVKESGCELRVLSQKDFGNLYREEWSNALCEKRRELDVLGVGAYEGGRLVGLAGCSADCDTMWQIGVDVLKPYRRKGIAAALTTRLAVEILKRGKLPFYCAAWSNIGSVRNAIKSGFRPAWVEMTAQSMEMVNEINNEPCSLEMKEPQTDAQRNKTPAV